MGKQDDSEKKITTLGLGEYENLKNWNERLNKTNPMSILEKHNNPLIRIEERQRRQMILDLVPDCSGMTIADVGCEEGYNASVLVDRCAKVYCIDIDSALLSIAKSNIKNDKAEFIQSDAQNINLPDNSVDIAISSHVLEHLPSPIQGFEELVRIVKPGGDIVINVPNERVVLRAKKIIKFLGLEALLGKLHGELAPGHLHIFDKKMFLNIVANKAEIRAFKYNFPFYTNMFALLKPKK